MLLNAIVPQHEGPVAAFAVLAPYLLVVLVILLLPVALLRRDALLALAVCACGLAGALAYPSPPPPPVGGAGTPIKIMTWNLHGEQPALVGLPEALARWSPDVIVLQEARSQDAVDLLSGEMTVLTFPHAATSPGMVIATRLPILDQGEVREPPGAWDRSRAFWIDVDTAAGPITVVGVHLNVPFPLSSLPCPYCPTRRDAQVAALRAFTESRGSAGGIVLAGDFNLTEREVAYRDLAALTDMARGNTWRPIAGGWLPPLLRLDYVFASPGISRGASETECDIPASDPSDHCPVVVELRIPGATVRR